MHNPCKILWFENNICEPEVGTFSRTYYHTSLLVHRKKETKFIWHQYYWVFLTNWLSESTWSPIRRGRRLQGACHSTGAAQFLTTYYLYEKPKIKSCLFLQIRPLRSICKGNANILCLSFQYEIWKLSLI